MEIIDARGLDCPRPVIMTKEAVEKGSRAFAVWVDNEVSASNVTRFLEGKGFSVKKEYGDTSVVLEAMLIDGGTGADRIEKDTISVMFTSDKLGADSDGLGDTLMRAYLGAVAQNEKPPAVMALMNTAVKMAVKGSSPFDYLCEIADKGSMILVCGTCTKHFGITEEVGVGVISNMFEITEALAGTSKTITVG